MNPAAFDPATEAHPSAELLAEFGLGLCGDDRAREIEAHVLRCDQCSQALAELPDDPLLDRLHQPADAGETNAHANLSDTEAGTMRASADGESDRFIELLRGHPKYAFVRTLGAGGMGVVYLAIHRVMNRMVALKAITPRLIEDPAVKLRFQREVQIAARLNHPNVVAAFDADEIDQHLFLVSEYVEGDSLDKLIEPGGLPISVACDIARQAALGLAHAHENGLIHRDVKPQNVLVSTTGEVKVVDFGLASYAESHRAGQHGLTSAGVIVGTPDYISPEQLREGAVDRRADIYGLGCTLYHALAGTPPFVGGSSVEKLAKHLQECPSSLVDVRQDIPQELSACVAKMMAKDPDQRFQSAEEVTETLRKYCDSTEISSAEVRSEFVIVPAADSGSRRQRQSNRAGRAGQTGRAHSTRRTACVTVVGILSVSLAGWWGWATFFAAEKDDFSSRNWHLLAVVPPKPLMRDVGTFYRALDDLKIDYTMTFASNAEQTEWIEDVVPLDQVNPQQFDAVVVLGPETSDETTLTADPRSRTQVQRILASMSEAKKPIASFGSGVWVLKHLDAIRGKRVADCVHSTPGFKRESGAKWMDGQSVVVDGDLITGAYSEDATPFLTQLLRAINELPQ